MCFLCDFIYWTPPECNTKYLLICSLLLIIFSVVSQRPAPKNEDEMMVLIFEYIDRIFSICRPRRVLYMAIDGVVSRFVRLNSILSVNLTLN